MGTVLISSISSSTYLLTIPYSQTSSYGWSVVALPLILVHPSSPAEGAWRHQLQAAQAGHALRFQDPRAQAGRGHHGLLHQRRSSQGEDTNKGSITVDGSGILLLCYACFMDSNAMAWSSIRSRLHRHAARNSNVANRWKRRSHMSKLSYWLMW